jgi:hypothetical protein
MWKQSMAELTFKIKHINFHSFYGPNPEDYMREI